MPRSVREPPSASGTAQAGPSRDGGSAPNAHRDPNPRPGRSDPGASPRGGGPGTRAASRPAQTPAPIIAEPVDPAQVFAAAVRLDRLEVFASQFGADFYVLPLNTDTLTLERRA